MIKKSQPKWAYIELYSSNSQAIPTKLLILTVFHILCMYTKILSLLTASMSCRHSEYFNYILVQNFLGKETQSLEFCDKIHPFVSFWETSNAPWLFLCIQHQDHFLPKDMASHLPSFSLTHFSVECLLD